MTVQIRHVTFDCADPYTLAGFWSQVTGYGEDPDNPNAPDDPEALLVAPHGGPALLFVKVPESKIVKNRVHFDVMPTDRTRDEELAWLRAIGATVFADHRRTDGSGWVTLTDPEGNEFCLERSAAERATATPAAG